MRAMILAATLLCSPLLLLALGCSSSVSRTPLAPGEKPNPRAVEATEDMVEDCEFMQTVYGAYDGVTLAGVMVLRDENAETSIRIMLSRATDLGATHVVVDDVDTNPRGGASSSGKAYRCATEEDAAEPAAE